MKISIIIPTHNRANQLKQALQAIMALKAEADLEVVVVDNNCTDHSKEVADAFGKHINYVFEKRTAFSRARKTGALNARGDILLYIDDDVLLRPGALSGLKEIFKNYPECGMVAGRIDPKFTPSPPSWTLVCNNAFNGWSLYNPETIQFLKENLCEVPWAAGPMMAIRTELFHKVGGFPPDTIGVETNVEQGTFRKLYVGNGDIGLSEKIRSAGFKIYCDPNISCYHVIPPIRYTIGFWRSRMIGEGHAMAVTDRIFYDKSPAQLFIERKRIQIRYLSALQKLLARITNLTNNVHPGHPNFEGMFPDELWVHYCAAYLGLDEILRRYPELGGYLWNLGAEGIGDKDFQSVINQLPKDYLSLIGRNVFDNANPVNSTETFEHLQTELPATIKAECGETQAILKAVENYCRSLPKSRGHLGLHSFFDDTTKDSAIHLLKGLDSSPPLRRPIQEWLAAFSDGSMSSEISQIANEESAQDPLLHHSGGLSQISGKAFSCALPSSKTDEGYLIIATENNTHVNLAVNAALSIRRLDRRPICLVIDDKVTIDDHYNCFFDEIKTVRNTDSVIGPIHKLYAYDYSPFRKTMFMDTDCLMIKRNIDFFWNQFDGMDLAFEGGTITTGMAHNKDAHFIRKRFKIDFIANFNSGVFYFEKTNRAENVFRKTQELYHSEERDVVSYKFKPGLYGDEGFFGVAMGIYNIKPVPIIDRMNQLQVPTPFSRDHHIDLDTGECFFIIGMKLEDVLIFSGTICHFCCVEPRAEYLSLASQLRRKANLSPYENLH